MEWMAGIAIGSETGPGTGTGAEIGVKAGRKGEAVDAGGFLLAGPYR
jgi:hypothetical protein